MRASLKLSVLLILPLLSPLAVAATQTAMVEKERARLEQEWHDYQERREKRALDLRACREQATAAHVAQTARAEFVHRCANAR